MLQFTAVNDVKLTSAARRHHQEQECKAQEALCTQRNEFQRLVSDAAERYKNDDIINCHETLEEAFELPWEDANFQCNDGIRAYILMALKLWFRSQPVHEWDEVVHALERFPGEVEFWRQLVDVLGRNNGKVNPVAIKAAWEALNTRVLIPERLDVLSGVYARLGDLGAARPLVQGDIAVEPRQRDEVTLSECKAVLHEPRPDAYAHLLITAFDSFASGSKGSLESLHSPLIVSFSTNDSGNGILSSSQNLSNVQSSQESSHANTPIKRRRTAPRQLPRRRSHTIEKIGRPQLADIINEYFPDVPQKSASEDSIGPFKEHLSKMNEAKICLVDRVECFLCCSSSSFITFSKMSKLLEISISRFNTSNPTILRMAARTCPMAASDRLIDWLYSNNESDLFIDCTKYKDPGRALSMVTDDSRREKLRSIVQIYHLLSDRNSTEDECVLQIDHLNIFLDESIEPDFKRFLAESVIPRLEYEDVQILFDRFSYAYWFPTSVALPFVTCMSPELAAFLLLASPDLPVHTLIWHVICGREMTVEPLLGFLDQSSSLFSDGGKLASKIVSKFRQTRPGLVWNLLRVMYRLPAALKVEKRYSFDDTFSASPTIEHWHKIIGMVHEHWSQSGQDGGEGINFADAESLIVRALKAIELPRITTQIAELNLRSMEHSFATYSMNILHCQIPLRKSLPWFDKYELYQQTVDLLYEIQKCQFVHKRRSPEWLQGFKQTIKSHWSTFGSRRVYSSLGLCLYHLLKYSVSTFEVNFLSGSFAKVKRRLKKAFLCFHWSGECSEDKFEVMGLILLPGLLQFLLPADTRSEMMREFVGVLHERLQTNPENWWHWYSLAECMREIDAKAALRPAEYAISLAKDDLEAQCFVYSLYLEIICSLQETERHYGRLAIDHHDLLGKLEKTHSFHRIIYALYTITDDVEEKRKFMCQLIPFIGKPRAAGLSNIKTSAYDRLGDLIYLQERYLNATIAFHHRLAPSVPMLLQIAQRTRTCGAAHVLNPASFILACAEAVLSLEHTKEDGKRLLSLMKDLPKSERLLAIAKELAK